MSQRDTGQTQVTTYEVKELLRFARQGRLRLPAFQRPARWRAPHVLELFDSIQRGYPIGTLLFGERPAAAGDGRTEFGAFRGDAPERHDALWVVDGQQRLSALLGALLHPDDAPHGDIHAIWFDLVDGKFVHVRREPPPVSVPLRALGDPKTTLRWADGWPLRHNRDDLVNAVFELAETITSFSVSAAIVRNGGVEALREIFKRLNNAGVAMREPEVFDALFGHLPQGRLKAAAAVVSSAGFGEISEDTFLRSLLAVEGLDPGTAADQLDPDKVPAMTARTERALRATFTFLSTEAEVPHLALLPYVSSPLRVLARFFARFERPSPRALTLLRRWFWRGCVSRQFSSASQGLVRRLQRCVDAPSAEEAARQLLTDQGAVPVHFQLRPDLEWRSRNAECRVVALALLSRAPLDPRTGGAFTADAVAQKLRGGADEEDAVAALGEAGDSPDVVSLSELCVDITGARSGTLVRRVMFEQAPPSDWWASASSKVLDGHCLTSACVEALRGWRAASDDDARACALRDFDSARIAALQAATRAYLEERCGAGDDDTPSVAEILRAADARMQAP